MAQFHGDHFMPFEIDDISFELFSDDQPVRNLPWECRLPDSLEGFCRSILAHHLHGAGRGDCFGTWESLEKSADAEPMISMAMCNVDRRQGSTP